MTLHHNYFIYSRVLLKPEAICLASFLYYRNSDLPHEYTHTRIVNFPIFITILSLKKNYKNFKFI